MAIFNSYVKLPEGNDIMTFIRGNKQVQPKRLFFFVLPCDIWVHKWFLPQVSLFIYGNGKFPENIQRIIYQ